MIPSGGGETLASFSMTDSFVIPLVCGLALGIAITTCGCILWMMDTSRREDQLAKLTQLSNTDLSTMLDEDSEPSTELGRPFHLTGRSDSVHAFVMLSGDRDSMSLRQLGIIGVTPQAIQGRYPGVKLMEDLPPESHLSKGYWVSKHERQLGAALKGKKQKRAARSWF